MSDAQLDHARLISLPSNLGVAYGDKIWEGGWQPYPFLLDAEREVVSGCFDTDNQNWFIVNTVNQSGKSSYFGTLLPFWYSGMFPDRQIIFITYSEGYSLGYGRRVRDLHRAYGRELFGLEIDPNNDGAGSWSFAGHPNGGMLSVGIGGQITGIPGSLVIIDDILRTMEDAASSSMKDKHWADWQGTIWGRRQPGSTYVVASTRLAEDDLPGRLMKQQDQGGGIPWKRLIYPGLARIIEDDYDGPVEEYRDRLGRKVGEPLHTRFSKPSDTPDDNWWKTAEKQLQNPQLFDCMVQQNPSNDETGMFPEDRWVLIPRDEWPEMLLSARGWDLAETEGKGDYTTGVLASCSGDGRYFIEGRYREQVGPEQGIVDLEHVTREDGYGVTVLIEEEKGGAAKKLVQFYKQALEGFPVEASPTDGTKEMRAATYSILQKGGKVILPADDEDAEWVSKWIAEHKAMMGDGRRPRHDDQIDAAAHAIRWLAAHDFAEMTDPNDMDVDEMLRLQDMLAEMGI